jgi:hypothetical protein
MPIPGDRTGFTFLWLGFLLGVAAATGGLLLGIGLIAVYQLLTGVFPGLYPIYPQAGFVAVTVIGGVGLTAAASFLRSIRVSRNRFQAGLAEEIL